MIFNHITVRIPGSEKEENGPYFLINPLGLRFNEVTASCLMTVTIDGEIIDQGSCADLINKHGRKNLEETFLKLVREQT